MYMTRVPEQRSLLTTRPFQRTDEASVVALWLRCGLVRANNNPVKDITRKSKVRSDLFRVGLIGDAIVATIMIGYDGHRGWINYLAVSPNHRRKGFGKQLMAEAERLLHNEGCPKINLQVRNSNAAVLAFYKAIGFVTDEVVSLGKRLEHD
jgi:ribosomal protein S18 acetylase RimI-like enzyme